MNLFRDSEILRPGYSLLKSSVATIIRTRGSSGTRETTKLNVKQELEDATRILFDAIFLLDFQVSHVWASFHEFSEESQASSSVPMKVMASIERSFETFGLKRTIIPFWPVTTPYSESPRSITGLYLINSFGAEISNSRALTWLWNDAQPEQRCSYRGTVAISCSHCSRLSSSHPRQRSATPTPRPFALMVVIPLHDFWSPAVTPGICSRYLHT